MTTELNSQQVSISVSGISKRYEIYSRPFDMMVELLTGKERHTPFWALHQLNFNLYRGETVGIIGQNGAGKSTLLKMIAGVLEPTTGQIQVNGRVSAILELGSGFNPERSGRDNVILGGMCRGMTKSEINNKIDWIVEFSELEDVIDLPLRTYSTGMQARLMFSTAICVDPEVLIVDEALAVGDIAFQRKCFSKIESLRDGGCTILFVSHSPETVLALCHRAIYLKNGTLLMDGDAKPVIERYMQDVFGSTGQQTAADIQTETKTPAPVETVVIPPEHLPPEPTGSSSDETTTTDKEQMKPQLSPSVIRYGDHGATIQSIELYDSEGKSSRALHSGTHARIKIVVESQIERIDDLVVGISITTTMGVRLFAMNTLIAHGCPSILRKDQSLEVDLGLKLWLAPGDYFITCGAWGTTREFHYDRLVDAIHFRIMGDAKDFHSLVNMEPDFKVRTFENPGVREQL